MVEVAAQNPLCAALSTISHENVYLSVMRAAFVKRMAYARAVLKVDPEPALKLLADNLALRASADGIQLKVETALRFGSQSIVAVGRAQDAVEGQIRCLRLELETRLSMEVTPTMNVWPWLVRHAGWLLERYHVKGNQKTPFADCFRKPYHGEVTKFAEAALFWLAVSPSGRIRDGIRQGRADARFVRGIWLGKTTESDEHLFATDTGVYTTRTVKRVTDTEERRADLVKSSQGTGLQDGQWEGLARQLLKHRLLRHLLWPKQVSDRAKMQVSAAVRRRKISLLRWSLMSSELLVRQIRRTNQAQHLDPWIRTMGALEGIQPVTITRRSDRQLLPRAVQMTERISVANGVCNQQVSLDSRKAMRAPVSSVMRVQQNFLMRTSKEASSNKLKTVDAEEIPCEFSVEDDFEVDETAEGVDEEIVKAIFGWHEDRP